MNDESIGTLWLLYREDGSAEASVIRGLIDKLVEERAQYIRQVLETSRDAIEFVPAAKRQFCIDWTAVEEKS